jgi:hypothetical protein
VSLQHVSTKSDEWPCSLRIDVAAAANSTSDDVVDDGDHTPSLCTNDKSRRRSGGVVGMNGLGGGVRMGTSSAGMGTGRVVESDSSNA